MATITAQQLVDTVKVLLNDATSVRWSVAELLGYLNDAQRAVVVLRPDAFTKTEALSLTVGNTKQNLPADGLRLMAITRNMGSNGTTPGRAIRMVDRAALDSQNPDWHTSTPGAQVMNFVYDSMVPKVFYVYPRVSSTHHIELSYSAAPPNILIGATILLDDVYSNAIVNYMLYRAYFKESEFGQNANLSTSYWNAFTQELGLKTQVDIATDPNPRVFMSPGVRR